MVETWRVQRYSVPPEQSPGAGSRRSVPIDNRGTVAKGSYNPLCVGYRYGFEFKEVDFEQPGIMAGEAFDVDDSGFQVVTGKAHCGYVLGEPVVGVVAKFREKGCKGIAIGKELNIFA